MGSRCSSTCRIRTAGSCTPTAPPASSSASPPRRSSAGSPSELFDPATLERWTEQNREVLRTGHPIDVEDGWGGRTHLTHKTPVFDAERQARRADRHLDRHHRPQARRGRSAPQRAQPRRGAADRRASAAGTGTSRRASCSGRPSSAASTASRPGETPTADEVQAAHPRGRPRARPVATRRRARGRGADGPRHPDHAPRRRDQDPALPRARDDGPDGSPHRLDGTCVDVTDRRRAERRLAEAQRLPSSAPGTGTSPATRSRGRARCTGSSARTPSTSCRPATC